MGIPSYYGWLKRFQSWQAQGGVELQWTNQTVDNLYVDMNSVIHPACHEDNSMVMTGDMEGQSNAQLFQAVMASIDRLVALTKPRKLLYLSIDGVAPAAKMKQQRHRRLRSSRAQQELAELETDLLLGKRDRNEPVPPFSLFDVDGRAWDSNVITPGTEFMTGLSEYMERAIAERVEKDPSWSKFHVILSDASVPGEGEHKILEYLRLHDAASSEEQREQDRDEDKDEPPKQQNQPEQQERQEGQGQSSPPNPTARRRGKDYKRATSEQQLLTEDAIKQQPSHKRDRENAAAENRHFVHVIAGEDADLTVLTLSTHLRSMAVIRNLTQQDALAARSVRKRFFEPPNFTPASTTDDSLARHAFRVIDIDKVGSIFKSKVQMFLTGDVAGKNFGTAHGADANDSGSIPAAPCSSEGGLDTPRSSGSASSSSSTITSATTEVLDRALDDLHVLFFMAGNDFIPFVPNFDIRENLLAVVLELYVKTVLSKGMHIVDPVSKRLDPTALRVLFGALVLHWERQVVDVEPELIDKLLQQSDLASLSTSTRRSKWNGFKSSTLCLGFGRTGSCSQRNRCERLHGVEVPRERSLHSILAHVCSFALTQSEPLLDKVKDGPLGNDNKFGDGSFRLRNGFHQSATVANVDGRLEMRLSNLDTIEMTNVKALADALRLTSLSEEGQAQLTLSAAPSVMQSAASRRAWALANREVLATLYREEMADVSAMMENYHAAVAKANDLALSHSDGRRKQASGSQAAEEEDASGDRDGATNIAGASIGTGMSNMNGPGIASWRWSRRAEDQPGSKEMSRYMYYLDKFDIDIRDAQGQDKVREIALEYLRGMQFVARYYFKGVPSWTWKYPYHYAPCVSDLLKVVDENLSPESYDHWPLTEPHSPVEQLMLVLPKASMRAMPSAAAALVHDPDISDMFPEPEAVELDPNGRRFRWQWVALLPQIDTEAVVNKVAITRDKWTERELRRDATGAAKLFTRPALLGDHRAALARDESPAGLGSALPLQGAVPGIRGTASNPKPQRAGSVILFDYIQHRQVRNLWSGTYGAHRARLAGFLAMTRRLR
jgi:5'-3' exonuclease